MSRAWYKAANSPSTSPRPNWDGGCGCHRLFTSARITDVLSSHSPSPSSSTASSSPLHPRTPRPPPQSDTDSDAKPKTIMQPAREDLAPPKDDPYTLEQLKEFSGADPSKPIYLSIKGTVFDVSRNTAVYGPEGSYAIFAGKDASMGLGMSSLKEEHARPEFDALDEKDRHTLDEWHGFFTKRYNIVGKVIDHPTLLEEERKAKEATEAELAEDGAEPSPSPPPTANL
ncbi:Cytochrome B5 [Mycena kentingensis (nom. inval.)]|nr:Cytochrome B5 [Mycena kentingensis (nom. inval.)]